MTANEAMASGEVIDAFTQFMDVLPADTRNALLGRLVAKRVDEFTSNPTAETLCEASSALIFYAERNGVSMEALTSDLKEDVVAKLKEEEGKTDVST